MELTKEVIQAITAHNAHKPEPCANDNWNKANGTASARGRHLVMCALDFRFGICAGSMRHKRATKRDVADYVIYRADSDLTAWVERAN